MVYRSHRRKSRKRSGTMKTRRKHSKKRTSRRRKSPGPRKKSRRCKSRKKSRKLSHVRTRKRSNRRSRKRLSQRKKSALSLKETRLGFKFSSIPSGEVTTSPDKLAEPLVVFGMDGCPGCDDVKKICKKKGIKFSYHLRKDNEEKVKKLAPGYKYVPVIVNRYGKFIGGSNELKKYTKNMPDVN